VGFGLDCIYSTADPQWPDDGREGRWRVKWSARGLCRRRSRGRSWKGRGNELRCVPQGHARNDVVTELIVHTSQLRFSLASASGAWSVCIWARLSCGARRRRLTSGTRRPWNRHTRWPPSLAPHRGARLPGAVSQGSCRQAGLFWSCREGRSPQAWHPHAAAKAPQRRTGASRRPRARGICERGARRRSWRL
jgi:hypothetical protein